MANMKRHLEMMVASGQMRTYPRSRSRQVRISAAYKRTLMGAGKATLTYAVLCVLAAVAGALVWL